MTALFWGCAVLLIDLVNREYPAAKNLVAPFPKAVQMKGDTPISDDAMGLGERFGIVLEGIDIFEPDRVA